MVSGTVCMDKYEASVWRVPNPTTANKGLVKKIQQGKATVADLAAGGATQLGTASDDYAPCADSGQNCANDIYAVSLPGVTPSAYITWFQAQAACENARKRLPSNAEWQAAVAGTPDPGPDNGTTDCNTRERVRGGRHRVAQQLRVGARGLRHGGQPVRVGGGLGAAVDGVRDWSGVSPTTCSVWRERHDGDRPGALLRGGDFFDGTVPVRSRSSAPTPVRFDRRHRLPLRPLATFLLDARKDTRP